MNLEEAKKSIESNDKNTSDNNVNVTYNFKGQKSKNMDELAINPKKKVSIGLRAIVTRDGEEDGGMMISIPLHNITEHNTPKSRKEVMERYAQPFYDQEIMELRHDYFEQMKPYFIVAAHNNKIRHKNLDPKRQKFEHKDGSMIFKSAEEIHKLCEWIEHVESVDELGVDEAENIQQAVVRLDSILKALGYAQKSLNIEKYEDNLIARKLRDKYDLIHMSVSNDAVRSKKIVDARIARFKNYRINKPIPISKDHKNTTVIRLAYDEHENSLNSTQSET